MAAAPTAAPHSDSVSTGAVEPSDTERSTLVNALAAADDDTDSDSEAEPTVPAEPAVAAVPAVRLITTVHPQGPQSRRTLSVQLYVNALAAADDDSDSDSEAEPTVPAEPAVAAVPAVSLSVDSPATPPPATQAAIEPLVHVSTNSTDRRTPRKRMTKAERAQWKLASHNTLGWTEEASYRQYSAMYAFAVSVSTAISEPRSYAEVTRSPHRVQWEQAMLEEIGSIKANDTFTLVPLPPARKAIGSKRVFKIKHHADGSIGRFKARLVAKGYSQQYGVDFTETFAPVARFSSLRAILAIAAAKDYEVHQNSTMTTLLPNFYYDNAVSPHQQ